MASIKAIEGRSVHQIQSGQVIVDLCSVVKELVENSLDAGATSIDVRFKNNGLDSIEVQDNGSGISPDDYENIALKHYTSKLATFTDLSSLNTFGFRGEALSSLCALSKFHIVTARDGEAPKGTRLDFEFSGKLNGTSVTASQKGATIAVEELFYNLPVRQRELEKNIKREYKKVLDVLQAYACISTGVRLSVTNQPTKGKKVTVFSTKSSQTSKDNIANIFGAKTLSAIIPLDLELELQPTTNHGIRDSSAGGEGGSKIVTVAGFVSRPVFGEGRSTPDRQMFFVNSRPCGLPQIAKAFNEVYKSYNITQSPFIFANLQMDTNAYDVNVSPDKRTILLHDQGALLESLKTSLTQLFEAQDQTVPQSEMPTKKSSSLSLSIQQYTSSNIGSDEPENTQVEFINNPEDDGFDRPSGLDSTLDIDEANPDELTSNRKTSLLQQFKSRNLQERLQENRSVIKTREGKEHTTTITATPSEQQLGFVSAAEVLALEDEGSSSELNRPFSRSARDFKDRTSSEQVTRTSDTDRDRNTLLGSTSGVDISLGQNSRASPISSAFDKISSKRSSSGTVARDVNPQRSIATTDGLVNKRRRISSSINGTDNFRNQNTARISLFSQKMHGFAAPGSKMHSTEEGGDAVNEDMDEEDDAQKPNEEYSKHAKGYERQQNIEARLQRDAYREQQAQDDSSDGEYIDEEERRRRDEAQVAEMLRQAEEAAEQPNEAQEKRAASILRSRLRKDSTVSLVHLLETSVQKIETQLSELTEVMEAFRSEREISNDDEDVLASSKTSPEERLSLTIAKSDFAEMKVIGQFNLGFILATRPPRPTSSSHRSDELFIIDQHASDEIFNFSRLSLSTNLTPQPLVRPHPLELTAIEEETVLSHTTTLAKNGFNITVDESGELPVGERCHLLTLPTSRETVFDTRDLEELIALLSEAGSISDRDVVRPTRVRKMLAMRACRSSIMVGKHLSLKGMETVVRHMGQIDKPWNCPHGRPTMRHLASLGQWTGWEEGEGLVDDDDVVVAEHIGKTDWVGFMERTRKTKHKKKEFSDKGILGDDDDTVEDENIVEGSDDEAMRNVENVNAEINDDEEAESESEDEGGSNMTSESEEEAEEESNP